MESILDINDLQIWFKSRQKTIHAVDSISFSLYPGETYALLGESGSGKTVAALGVCQLLTDANFAKIDGRILLHQNDLLDCSEIAMQKVRGKKIAFIFQEPMTALNPILTVEAQISESARDSSTGKIIELLKTVGLSDPERRLKQYPHELSGGMRQRVMIAMALACKPEILIADEPTTALDVTTQAQILSLIKEIQNRSQMAVILITHDLGIVSDFADRVGVMYSGHIIEEAPTKNILSMPKHPYTFRLIEAMPNIAKRDMELSVLPGNLPKATERATACRFAPRCDFVTAACRNSPVPIKKHGPGHFVRCLYEIEFVANTEKLISDDISDKAILTIDNLTVSFPIRKGLFKRQIGAVHAVNQVSLRLNQNQTLALVGESGCGKTTLARALIGLNQPKSGAIIYKNHKIDMRNRKTVKSWHKDVQIIFQDPYSSMNPRMMVRSIIAEGALALGLWHKHENIDKKIVKLLEKVGLDNNILNRYPHEFSGGQRQRIVIARALAVKPKILICDEPTSALDVSVQAQVLNLLKDLQRALGLSYLFITHNLHAVSWLADYIAVMYLGRIVEYGDTRSLLLSPKHPYTKLLIDSLPNSKSSNVLDKYNTRDVPSPINLPQGCYFYSRCPQSLKMCKTTYPKKTNTEEGGHYYCHNANSTILF